MTEAGRSSYVGGGRGASEALRLALAALADPDVAAHSARFFQAGPGGYGEGDRFLGIRVPDLRALARAQRARVHGLPEGVLLILGAANLAYATYSFTLARSPRRTLHQIEVLVVANAAWAVVCVALVVRYGERASAFGFVHLLGEALFVGGLAAVEWRLRHRLVGEVRVGGLRPVPCAYPPCARHRRVLPSRQARASDVRRFRFRFRFGKRAEVAASFLGRPVARVLRGSAWLRRRSRSRTSTCPGARAGWTLRCTGRREGGLVGQVRAARPRGEGLGAVRPRGEAAAVDAGFRGVVTPPRTPPTSATAGPRRGVARSRSTDSSVSSWRSRSGSSGG